MQSAVKLAPALRSGELAVGWQDAPKDPGTHAGFSFKKLLNGADKLPIVCASYGVLAFQADKSAVLMPAVMKQFPLQFS